MIEFAGFKDWVPIFKGGKQRDSKGVEHDGDALIDKAIEKFNPSFHEPPAVIGHPGDDAPAYGWVEGLKKEVVNGTKLLFAKFKQVQPTFADMVKSGMFKKRSAAFYPDGSLRHVGFLGAMPPAVKGLPDVAFSEPADATFEFADSQTAWAWESLGRLFGRIRDYLIEKDGVEKADQVIGSYEIQTITDKAASEKQEARDDAQITNYNEKKEVQTMNFKEFMQELKSLLSKADAGSPENPAAKTFSEAEMATATKQAQDEAARKEREKVTAEFAEKERKTRQDGLKKEISSWCEAMIKKGRMTPAMVKYGLPEILFAVGSMEDQIEFGEEKAKATAFERLKGLFETELPKLVEFKEIATRDRDAGGRGTSGEKIEKLIGDKMKADKTLSYGAAFAEVQRENPELANEYVQEIRG